MMTTQYKVIEEIRVKTKSGEKTITPGQIIKLAPSKALQLIEGGKLKPLPEDVTETISQKQPSPPTPYQPNPPTRGQESAWKNPYPQGSQEGRRETLMAVMEAVWTSESNGIISKVLGGQAKLADFKKATEQWARICVKEGA